MFDVSCNIKKSDLKKCEHDYSQYFFRLLFKRALSIFKWTGKPFDGVRPDMNSDYLEWCLLTQGYAGAIKDNDGILRGLRCTRVGYDCYYLPDEIIAANPVLGTLTGKVGDDCVFIKGNKTALPAIDIINHYAIILAKLQVSLNVSLNNNRMTKIFHAENDAQANQIRKMQDDVSAGKDAIIIKSSLISSIMDEDHGTVPVYGTPSDYLSAAYLQDIRTVINDFYVQFGVNASGANMVKRERNTVSEVDSNNQEILINREFWLEPRKKAAEQINEMFGTDIKVEMVGESDVLPQSELSIE